MPLLPSTIKTARLLLRQPCMEDAGPVFRAYGQDPEVAHFMVWRPHTTVQETETFFRECIECWKAEARCPYVLTETDNDQAIGMLDARFDGHVVDVGYVLQKRSWGYGLMTEALSGLVAELSTYNSIYRIQATCDVENAASRITLERSGFQCEGKLGNHTIHPNISPIPRACYMFARYQNAA